MHEAEETIFRSENTIATNLTSAAPVRLSNAAQKYGEPLQSPLTTFAQALNNQISIIRDTVITLKDFGKDLEPLLQSQTDMSTRKSTLRKLQADFKKTTSSLESAKAALAKAQASGKSSNISKAELNFSAANSKFEFDQKYLNEYEEKLKQDEAPYQQRFLQQYIYPVQAMASERVKRANEFANLYDSFMQAVEQFQPIKDDFTELQEEKKKYRKLLKEELEESDDKNKNEQTKEEE